MLPVKAAAISPESLVPSNKKGPYVSLIMLSKHYSDLRIIAHSISLNLFRKRPSLTSAMKSMTKGKCWTIHNNMGKMHADLNP